MKNEAKRVDLSKFSVVVRAEESRYGCPLAVARMEPTPAAKKDRNAWRFETAHAYAIAAHCLALGVRVLPEIVTGERASVKIECDNDEQLQDALVVLREAVGRAANDDRVLTAYAFDTSDPRILATYAA